MLRPSYNEKYCDILPTRARIVLFYDSQTCEFSIDLGWAQALTRTLLKECGSECK